MNHAKTIIRAVAILLGCRLTAPAKEKLSTAEIKDIVPLYEECVKKRDIKALAKLFTDTDLDRFNTRRQVDAWVFVYPERIDGIQCKKIRGHNVEIKIETQDNVTSEQTG